ncbi:GvpL/GvpF family gas vesicle protein [Amycolatopsis rhabdoformis]|uniref:GvpL/GvpF family gas vesicle protein n=1 Tax=Amycolatopsis rhabdoformis TaxID=1448059 RepID=A0ABZ1ILK4_9PSEU|nr:GvpL/GvpF family gas vesicle protein [Amycolatopsis rhabdoformis]WSE34668.1 GvpL/GvpF family gas vesicle protein [Amycolatopsis rhabdoformis]
MSGTDGIWLYAVTRSAASLTGLPGVAASPPRVVEGGGLAAVVADVPLRSFGEDALRRNLEDLDWLAAVARAHDAVIATLAEQGPVVPIRLATVYHDDASVSAVLEARAGDFDRTLDHVAGRIEWGVKAFLEPAAEPARAAASPSGQGAGAAYLARRRTALASREDRQQRAAEQVGRLHAALAESAADACRHPPQSRELAGVDGPMVLNGAYLVEAEQADRFAETVAACGRDSDVLSVRLTGPWPPYSFSALEET